MRSLPLYNELWQESLKRDDFTIITVAGDDRETMPRLREILRENDVQFPVLHYLDGDEGGQFEYDVQFYGCDMLIDPQGVIVDNIWVREDFFDVLEFLKTHAAEIPRVAADISVTREDDGSYTATVLLSRSDHLPLPLYCGGWYQYYGEREGDEPDEFLGEGDPGSERTLEFGEFGDATFEIHAESRDELRRLYFWVWLTLPGTEPLYDGDGLTVISDLNIWFDENGDVKED